MSDLVFLANFVLHIVYKENCLLRLFLQQEVFLCPSISTYNIQLNITGYNIQLNVFVYNRQQNFTGYDIQLKHLVTVYN